MSKHTPGPWERGAQHESKVDIVCVKDGKFHASIARVSIPLPRTLDHKEMQANARLIAAAPELLSALQACVAFIETCNAESSGNAELTMAADAIAKATGAA